MIMATTKIWAIKDSLSRVVSYVMGNFEMGIKMQSWCCSASKDNIQLIEVCAVH